MKMSPEFLTPEVLKSWRPDLAIHATCDSDGGWIAGDRQDVTSAPFGANLDNSVILDFDANGYLASVELIGSKAAFDVGAITLPADHREAVIRLSNIPSSPGSTDFDGEISTIKNGEGTYVLATMLDGPTTAATWFALSETVYMALNEGRFEAVLFVLT
ncbi:MAG TPA: hypothetical protein VGD01_11445 [Candidatus Elarobacter sp.]